MYRKIISLILCMAVSLTLMACQSSEINLQEEKDETEIIFSWWGTDARHDYTMEAIKAFEEKYPNIKVKLEYGEWTGYDTKTDVKMASRTQADIMQINFAWINKYSADGSGFYDLNKLPNLDLSSFSESSLKYGMSNGVLNALPIALNSKVFMYNKTIYDKCQVSIPKTWEDLFNAAKVMNPQGYYPLELDEAGAYFVCLAYVEQSTGKSIFDENGNFAFTEEQIQQMIDFYIEMVNNGVVVSISDKDGDGFSKGTYAGTVQWITNSEKNQKLLADNGFEMVVGELPIMNGAANSGWYSKPASMYAVSNNATHLEEIGLLLDFLVNSEEMSKLQQMEKGVPVSQKAKDVLSAQGLLEGIQNDAQTIVDATDTKIAGNNLENSSIQAAIKAGFDNVLYAGMSSDEAAVQAYGEIQEALNK